MLKKTISPIALATLALGAQAADVVLKVAASAVPHAEILNFVKPQLKAQGVDLQVREFSDYIQPNAAVEDKQLDANFFQHQPYLDSYNRDRKSSIVGVADGTVHVEPFGAYSRKIKAASELKDPKNITATPVDIVKNPKNLKFRELEAALLPRALDDVDLALINTNYAIEAKLNPTKDSLFLESGSSHYANFIAARKDRANDPSILKLVKALRTPEVKKFIQDKYKGAIIPAF